MLAVHVLLRARLHDVPRSLRYLRLQRLLYSQCPEPVRTAWVHDGLGHTVCASWGLEHAVFVFAEGANMDRQAQMTELSRRTFLTTTSTALIGAALGGLASHGTAGQRHPQ